AEAYGLSQDQIRSRIKKGEIAGRRVPRGENFQWEIEPPTESGLLTADLEELRQLRERAGYYIERAVFLEKDRDAWRDLALKMYEDSRASVTNADVGRWHLPDLIQRIRLYIGIRKV